MIAAAHGIAINDARRVQDCHRPFRDSFQAHAHSTQYTRSNELANTQHGHRVISQLKKGNNKKYRTKKSSAATAYLINFNGQKTKLDDYTVSHVTAFFFLSVLIRNLYTTEIIHSSEAENSVLVAPPYANVRQKQQQQQSHRQQ